MIGFCFFFVFFFLVVDYFVLLLVGWLVCGNVNFFLFWMRVRGENSWSFYEWIVIWVLD